MDDGALVRDAVGGSVPAFTTIFDRHVAQVHDVALALLRDRTAALELVQLTFREASERLEALRQPDRLLVWLLAITRFHAAERGGDVAGQDRRPTGIDTIPERAELAAVVWDATADLPMRERALIDLHLRQGLDGDDLADALGVSPGELAEMRAWMQGVEKGLAGYLLVRRGDGHCRDLPLVLRGWDGRFTPLIASHIGAHVDTCRVCRAASAEIPSPYALYASAPQAPLPDSGGAEPTPTEAIGGDL
jgi:DNA-directed RNA polymerase specialized sigma24 family protein